MSGADVSETLKTVMERWGFPTLVALAAGWTLRADILLPMVQAHREFLQKIEESQSDIAQSLREQTRLLYEIQPRTKEQKP